MTEKNRVQRHEEAPFDSIEPLRLFVAVELPDIVRSRLVSLKTPLPATRWTPPDNLHLTLRFIGDAPRDHLRAIERALTTVRASPFSLRIDRLGLFERKDQTIVWAGFEKSDELLSLKRRIDAALKNPGKLKLKTERFSPHVTLARTRGPIPSALRAFVDESFDESIDAFPVEGFTLFSSELLVQGAIHYPERRYSLR